MASTPLADRPGGADLLTLLRARIWTVVVVDTLDRLFPTLAECMAYVESWGLQGVMLRVLDFEGEVLTLSADNNALFLAALAECRAMSHEGRLTRTGRRARTMAALGALPHDRGERRRGRSCCSCSLEKVYSRNSSRLFLQARAEASLCYDGAIITTMFMACQYCRVFA